MRWLASQSSFSLTFLILECKVVIPLLSAVWMQVQVQVHLLQVQECLLQFPPFLLKNIESEMEEVSDFVGWTRSGKNFSTELCRTKFLSYIISRWGLKLSFFFFCESAVFLSWLLDLCWASELLRRLVVGVGPGPSPWVCIVLHHHRLVGVLMVLKEGGLLSLGVGIGVPLPSMVLEEGRLLCVPLVWWSYG